MSDAKNPKEPLNPVMVEISKDTLEKLLSEKIVEIGKNFRVIKTLEIHPGSVIAKQYDR
jgi:hypothetical protein